MNPRAPDNLRTARLHLRRLAHMDTHWQRHGFGDWGIVESEAERLIGFAGLHHIDGMREVNLG